MCMAQTYYNWILYREQLAEKHSTTLTPMWHLVLRLASRQLWRRIWRLTLEPGRRRIWRAKMRKGRLPGIPLLQKRAAITAGIV